MAFGHRIGTQAPATSAAVILGATEIAWCIIHEALNPATTTGGLQEAHDWLPADGGWIILCNGRRDITDQVNIAKPNIKIIGHENSHLDFQIDGGALYGLNITNTGCELRDFRVTCDVDDAVVETTTDTVYVNDGHDFISDNVVYDTGPAAGRSLTLLTVNSARVHNNIFRNDRDDSLLVSGGINTIVHSNYVTATGGIGIQLASAAGPVDPDDCIVYGNLIDGPSDHAISCTNADRVQVLGNHVLNGVTGATFGIHIDTCYYAQVNSNNIENWNAAAAMYGIAIDSCQFCTIDENVIHETSGYGIVLYGAQPSQNIIANNIICAPESSAILAQACQRLSILGNSISWGQTATTYGIHMQETSNSQVCNNIIENWDSAVNMGGILWTDGVKGIISDNSILTCSGHGIWLDDAAGVDPDDCIVSGNMIDAPSGDGIRCEDADRVQVLGNHITNGVTAATFAIFLDNCDYSMVDDNMIDDWDAAAGMIGIHWTDGLHGSVRDNHTNATSAEGILVEDAGGTDPDDMIISGNMIMAPGANGIRTEDADRCLMSGNHVSGLTVAAGFHGIDHDGGYSLIADNLIFDWDGAATADGIRINGLYVHVTGNTLRQIGDAGINGVNVTGSLFSDNWIFGTGGAGIETTNLGRGMIIGNNIISAGGSGIESSGVVDYSVVSMNNIYDCGGIGIELHRGQWTTVEGNMIYSPASHGIYCYTDTDDPDDYLILNNMVDAPTGHGIFVENGDRAQVLGNHITNGVTAATYAVYLNNCDYSQASDNNVWDWDAAANMDGIKVSTCSQSIVCGNMVQDASLNGINMDNSGQAVVNSNNVNSCGADGITLNSGNHIVCNGNISYDNASEQIHVIASDWTAVIGNDLRAGVAGVKIDTTSDESVIADNIIALGTYGVEITATVRVTVIGNVITDTTSHGIYAYTTGTDPDDLVIGQNIIDTPTNHGIYVQNGDRCQIAGNHICNGVTAVKHAVWLVNCDAAMVQTNHIFNWDAQANMRGIYWQDGVNGIVSDNYIEDCTGEGIFIWDVGGTDPDNLLVANNFIDTVAGTGIRLVEADRAQVLGNQILRGVTAATNGIYLNDCDFSKVMDNLVYDWDANAGMDGINVTSSARVTVHGNTVMLTTSEGIVLSGTTSSSVCYNYTFTTGLEGILASNGSDDCQINGNWVDTPGSHGIYANGDRVQVSMNRISGGTGAGVPGINLAGCNTVGCVGNWIYDFDANNVCDGIYMDDCVDGLIASNMISNIGRDGIHLNATGAGNTIDVLVNGNRCKTCATNGIFFHANVQQSEMVNNHCRGEGLVLGAGVGNQNDWGTGVGSFNRP